MTPDDPRHGTKAGRSQHSRDGEDSCVPCRDADNVASRRRRKRKSLGQEFTRPIGEPLYEHLAQLRDHGVSFQDIATAAGVSYSQAWLSITNGPEYRVHTSTWRRLNTVRGKHFVTRIGLTRRVQALQRAGYSTRRIGLEVGMSLNALKPIRQGTSTGAPAQKNRDALVALYERWQMTVPTVTTVSERRSVTQARNKAIANGYAPALAWDDIDDPNEIPDIGGDRPDRGADGKMIAHDQADIDDVVVLRLLEGDTSVTATKPEKVEAMRRWLSWGRPEAELCAIHGWKDGRYVTREETAA